MRLLLATTCLTPIALCAALPAAAQTVISGNSGPVKTSTADGGAPSDLIISSTGKVSGGAYNPGPYYGVTMDSDNNVTNQGTISISVSSDGAGIEAKSHAGNIVNSGSILLGDNTQLKDNDQDGDYDGPFATGVNRCGICAANLTGSINNDSYANINVSGDFSSGLVTTSVFGNISNYGTISTYGDNDSTVYLTNTAGAISLAGSITAAGRNSLAVYIDGGVSGAVTLSGHVTATGYRYVTPPSDVSKLDADDLLQGGPAVWISGDVAGGVSVTPGATVSSFGENPALRLNPENSDATIGAGADGFGLAIDGTVSGVADYAGHNATGVEITASNGGNAYGMTITKGVRIDGTVSATSLDRTATALDITAATVPLIQVGGTVKAVSGDTINAEAFAISLNGAAVETISNTGDVEAVTGRDGLSVAILDSNDHTLKTIVNAGSIKASTSGEGVSVAISLDRTTASSIVNTGLISATGASNPQNNIAIYFDQQNPGATINQNASAAGAPAPAIIGDVYLGGGADRINLNAGSLTGNVSFGQGDNRFTAANDATMTGVMIFGAGADTVALTGASVVTGELDLGRGNNFVLLQGQSTLNGAIYFGSGDDNLAVQDSSLVKGDVDFGDGSNLLSLSGGSLTGNVIFGSDTNQLILGGGSVLTGNVDFSDGVSHLSMYGQTALNGEVAFGLGDDRIDLVGTSVLNGDVGFGEGKNLLFLKDAAVLNGNATFGAGDDDVGLAGMSSLVGALSLGDGANTLHLGDTTTIKGHVTFGGGDNMILASGMSVLAGNVTFGDGNNELTLTEGSALAGNATFGNGANSLDLNGAASMKGDAAFGSGKNVLVVGDTAIMTGNATFGDGDDTVRLVGGAALAGNVMFGKGSDVVTLSGTSTLIGPVSFGDGANKLTVADAATLTGKAVFGGDIDLLVLMDKAKLTGNVDLGGGADLLQLGQSATLAGDVTLGAGNDILTIADTASLAGNVSFGPGNDSLTMTGAAVYAGTADFGGDGADSLALNGTSRFSGTLSNAQKLAVVVNGGTLAVSGTGTTTIGSLVVASSGTLGVTIDATANATTHYAVLGNASFDPGSKLAIILKGAIANEATYTVLTAGTITGAGNLTASQLSLPFMFKSSLVNAPANEIAVQIARKTAGELGLNRSETIAYDAVFAALAKDAKVQAAVFGLQDAKGVQAAIASMLPDHAGGTFEAVTSGSRAMGRMLADADAPFADEGKWGFWIDGVTFNRTKSPGDTAAYDVKGSGTAGGAEIKTEAGNFGLSIAYLHGTDRIVGAANSVKDDQYEGALYWRGNWGGLHPFARVSAARIDFAGTRTFTGTTGTEAVKRTASASWGGTLYSAAAGASYDARFGKLSLRPIVSLDYYRLTEDAYAETGGGAAFDLNVAKRTSDEFAGNATLAGGLTFGSRDGGWLRAEIEGGRRQVLAGSLGATIARFDGGQAFTLIPEDRTSGWVGRLHLTGGVKSLRLGADIGREQQQGRAATSLRATLQYGF